MDSGPTPDLVAIFLYFHCATAIYALEVLRFSLRLSTSSSTLLKIKLRLKPRIPSTYQGATTSLMTRSMFIAALLLTAANGFLAPRAPPMALRSRNPIALVPPPSSTSSTSLSVASFEQISLAASQENTGLALVVMLEAIYSFFQAPGLRHSLILLPPIAAAYVLIFISGPVLDVPDVKMINGLAVSAGVSAALIGSYYLRMSFPSPSPKVRPFVCPRSSKPPC